MRRGGDVGLKERACPLPPYPCMVNDADPWADTETQYIPSGMVSLSGCLGLLLICFPCSLLSSLPFKLPIPPHIPCALSLKKSDMGEEAGTGCSLQPPCFGLHDGVHPGQWPRLYQSGL